MQHRPLLDVTCFGLSDEMRKPSARAFMRLPPWLLARVETQKHKAVITRRRPDPSRPRRHHSISLGWPSRGRSALRTVCVTYFGRRWSFRIHNGCFTVFLKGGLTVSTSWGERGKQRALWVLSVSQRSFPADDRVGGNTGGVNRGRHDCVLMTSLLIGTRASILTTGSIRDVNLRAGLLKSF